MSEPTPANRPAASQNRLRVRLQSLNVARERRVFGPAEIDRPGWQCSDITACRGELLVFFGTGEVATGRGSVRTVATSEGVARSLAILLIGNKPLRPPSRKLPKASESLKAISYWPLIEAAWVFTIALTS